MKTLPRGLYTSEVNTLAKELKIKNYLGAFPDDISIELPQTARFVMNYQGSDEGGSHWYGVIRKGKEAFVYDSLGAPPDDRLLSLLRKNKVTKVHYSTKRTQRDDDNVCGVLAVQSLTFN